MYTAAYRVFDKTKQLDTSTARFTESMVRLNMLFGENFHTALKRTIYGSYKGPRMAGLEVECDIHQDGMPVYQWKFTPVSPF